MTFLLRDQDNHYEPNAMIQTDTLTATELQELIYDIKAENPDYDNEILTDELVNWIYEDEEVYW